VPYVERITDATELGRVIRAARKELGLSQRALAQRCSCSQRFVSELERGKATAEVGKAMRLLNELGLTFGVVRHASARMNRLAVEELANQVSSELGKASRKRTSLADYL
jgi:transcriptional regulator with XRE-family HTH domain